jgi:hypothetical protein
MELNSLMYVHALVTAISAIGLIVLTVGSSGLRISAGDGLKYRK